MTFSQNFEVVMQIIGRILRKSDKISRKYFFKVAPKNTASYFVDWMNALFMLFDEEWYSKFDGKNGFDIEVPNTLIGGRKKQSTKRTNTRTPGHAINKGNFKPSNLDNFTSLSFMSTNKWFKLNDRLSTVATTTLGKICALHQAAKPLAEFKKELINNTKKVIETKDDSKKIIKRDEYIAQIKAQQELQKNKKNKARLPKAKIGKSLSDLKKVFIK